MYLVLYRVNYKYMRINHASWTFNIENKSDYTFSVLCDNQSALAIVKSKTGMSPQKHIDIRIKWLQEMVENKLIIALWVGTKENGADGLTKSHEKCKHTAFLKDNFVNV